MIVEEICLNKYYPLDNNPTLTSFCPSNFDEFSGGRKRKCVLVIPGGAYVFVSEREGEPVALKFAGADIAAFVLRYTIAPNLKYPVPLTEVYAALSYIRRNASHYGVDPDKISVCGFSAGGHLAAISSAFCEKAEFANLLGIDVAEMKINGCILGYPVISNSYPHEETFDTISGKNPELREKLSVEKCVTPNFPKSFIWHTTFDNCVNVMNSLVLAEALSKNKVFYEMHIYPIGDHGLSISDETVYPEGALSKETLDSIKPNTDWVKDAINFVKNYI